jgi:hypothetical protein
VQCLGNALKQLNDYPVWRYMACANLLCDSDLLLTQGARSDVSADVSTAETTSPQQEQQQQPRQDLGLSAAAQQAAANSSSSTTSDTLNFDTTSSSTDVSTDVAPDQQQPQLAVIRTAQHDKDSHLLERVAFAAAELHAPSALQVVDLCTVLALCLDVQNSNPRDGLTNEQMSPYVDRVLRAPSNWMVYRYNSHYN